MHTIGISLESIPDDHKCTRCPYIIGADEKYIEAYGDCLCIPCGLPEITDLLVEASIAHHKSFIGPGLIETRKVLETSIRNYQRSREQRITNE